MKHWLSKRLEHAISRLASAGEVPITDSDPVWGEAARPRISGKAKSRRERGENRSSQGPRFELLNRSRRREAAEGLANQLSSARHLGGYPVEVRGNWCSWDSSRGPADSPATVNANNSRRMNSALNAATSGRNAWKAGLPPDRL